MQHRVAQRNPVILRAAAVWFLLIAGMSAKSWSQVPDEPVKWSIKAQTSGSAAKRGERFSLQLTAEIEEGWHLYSTEQEEGGPNPTRIVLPPGQPFEQAGAVESSQPKSAFDPNFNLATEFYDSEAAFAIPVKVAATAAPGKWELRVDVSFQTCNDRLCLPPKTVKLVVEINVTAAR